jgi:hypothetical protein
VVIVNTPGPTLAETLVPESRTADSIWIASGYVSVQGCKILRLRKTARDKRVHLVVGRAMEDGLTRSAKVYLSILDEEAGREGGGVRIAQPCSHAKMYCFQKGAGDHWSEDSAAFVGSSNLTPHGLEQWHEGTIRVGTASSQSVYEEIQRLYDAGRPVTDAPPRREPTPQARPGRTEPVTIVPEPVPAEGGPELGLRMSLLQRDETVPLRSGLNWWNAEGRPRHSDEAYLPLRVEVVRSGEARLVFGSVRPGTRFQAIFHDGSTMEMSLQGTQPVVLADGRTIESAKQITSADNTHDFGTWILRRILQVDPGQVVTREILETYGRTDILFQGVGTAPDGSATVFVDFTPD